MPAAPVDAAPSLCYRQNARGERPGSTSLAPAGVAPARKAPAMTTAIANGTIATDYGVFDAHIVIKDGRISHLTDDDSVLRSADEVIDARGLTVLPGAIDPHAHFEDPGHTEREDFYTGTMSAVAGGITTVV